ncbi:glucose 1-dehydrogenase [Shinella sp. BYT-45]|uniref:glucose 1-dehydrogenase n=1 Tax=Shinella sp. BYT-45 TaxID=3377377 RepID=UPI003980EA34
MGKLHGKVALITGGNSGIGLESAKLFAQEGARVILTGRRREAVDEAVRETGHDAVGFVGDIANLDDHDRLVALARDRFGRIDIYFANAGVITLSTFQDASVDMFDQTFAVNVRGTYFGIQKALPVISDGGSIIMTGSIASYVALDSHNVYAATKAALRSFARSWAKDLRDRKIRVNVLSPGPVRTPILGKAGLDEAEAQAMEEMVSQAIPLGRFGEAEELARAALFLASDDSSFVNGIELSVDGGMAQI